MDEKDKKILSLLRENAKLTVKQLARELETPPSTVHDRIQKLQDEKVIKKYTILTDYNKTGLPITAFVLAKYLRGSKKTQRELGREISKIPRVQEVHLITGNWDFLIKARIEDIDELATLTVDELSSLQGIGGLVTLTSLNQVLEKV